MPLYEFRCPQCSLVVEELRKTGDYSSIPCAVCGCKMEKLISVPNAIFKGPGWVKGTWEKAKKRSKEQGKKFYKGYEKYQEKVEQVQYPTDTYGNYTGHTRKSKAA